MALKLKKNQKPPASEGEEYLEIAEKVRTGEYFREARSMYDLGVHDPMAERYMYAFITIISLFILTISLKAMQDYYPLNTEIPMIINADDNGEDIAHIQRLMHSKKENPSEMLVRFMVKNYIISREEYDIGKFDRDVGTVKSESNDAVSQEYQHQIDPANPESPITLYQRHSKRKIHVTSMRPYENGMEVVYDAEVESRTDLKRSRWYVNIAFQYSGLELDEKTGNIKPLEFIVTKYHSKRLQDIK